MSATMQPIQNLKSKIIPLIKAIKKLFNLNALAWFNCQCFISALTKLYQLFRLRKHLIEKNSQLGVICCLN